MSIKREWTTPITAGAFLLLAVTALVLWIARFAILRMQVTYSTEG